MAVQRHRRPRLEADEVQHRGVSEERLPAHPGRELEGAEAVQSNELCFLLGLHALDYRSPRDRRRASAPPPAGVSRRGVGRRRLRRDLPGRQPRDGRACSRRSRGWERTRPGGRSGRRARPSRLAAPDCEGARTRAAATRGPHARERGRARAAHGARAREAARRGARRGAVRGVVLRVVRGGGEARLRRHGPDAVARQADPRDEGAGRRDRRGHALELPVGDAHPEVRAGVRGRLHDGAQARPSRRRSRRSPSPRSPRRRACRTVSSPS